MDTSPCNYSSLCCLLCSIVTEHFHKGKSQNHKWKGHSVRTWANHSTCYTTYALKSELAHKCADFRRVRKIAG